MNDFFERLREDAAPLRHEPDGAAMTRVAARIRERVAQPTVAELLARWLRPVAAALTAVAIVAIVSVVSISGNDEVSFVEEGVEVTVAGATYRVE
jgi:hypothetical protein